MTNSEILRTIRKILKEQANQNKNWINEFPCLKSVVGLYQNNELEDNDVGVFYKIPYENKFLTLIFSDGSSLILNMEDKNPYENVVLKFWFCIGSNNENIKFDYKPYNEMNIPKNTLASKFKEKKIAEYNKQNTNTSTTVTTTTNNTTKLPRRFQ